MVPVVYPPSVLISTWILMCVSHKRPHSELQVQPCGSGPSWIRTLSDDVLLLLAHKSTPTSLRQARMPAFDINADVPLIPDGPANGSCPAQLLQGPGNGGGDRDTEQMAACSTQSHYVANLLSQPQPPMSPGRCRSLSDATVDRLYPKVQVQHTPRL